MNILISCVGRRGYLAQYFRDSLEGNCRVLGTGNTNWTPGFRECDAGILMPNIDAADYGNRVVALCQDQQIDLFFSVSDPDVHYLAPYRQALQQLGIATFLVTPEVSTNCFDKMATVRFLSRHGFRTPATFDNLDEAQQALLAKKIDFPLFVKPRYGSSSQNLFMARNDAELSVFFQYSQDMIVQAKADGNEYSLDILNDLQSRPISVVLKRKVAMRCGETDQAVTVKNQQLLDWGTRLGATLQHVGPMDVDFFWDGGDPVVLELNPRFGGGYPISQLAGADFPELMIAIARGEQVLPQIGHYREGVRMMKEILAVRFEESAETKIRDFRQDSTDGSPH